MPSLPVTARQLRLASGLVLLTYLSLHLLTHMSGLVSLDVAEAGLRLSVAVWQSVPGTVLLYGAFFLHLSLALRTIYLRRHWQLPVIEWVRLWGGFSLPLLLLGHVVATRVAAVGYGYEPTYARVIAGLIASGSQGWQVALLAPGWVHGCLGVWLSVRHHPAAQSRRRLLLGLLVAVPLLSAAGFMRMERAVTEQRLVSPPRSPAAIQALGHWRHALLAAYALLVIGAAGAGVVRARSLAAAR